METVLLVLEIIGTAAFAVSGAFVGVRRDMDVFGVIILGLTTAVGGGIIRDLILGITPPRTFLHPIYATIAISASIIVFLIARRGFTEKTTGPYGAAMLVMDSLGLGAFTVSARTRTTTPSCSCSSAWSPASAAACCATCLQG